MSRQLTFNNHEASDVLQGMDPLREKRGRCVFVPAVMHKKKKKSWRLVAMAVSVSAGLEFEVVMVRTC